MSVAVLKPNGAGETYEIAAQSFADLYEKVTGVAISVIEQDDGVSDLFVIGSDAVADFVMHEILELRLESIPLRYGTDDYCIQSHRVNERRVVILAGGRGRSTLYAVYDYFERFAECHYYWDGDRIGHCDELPMEDIHVVESPHFFYRGLRYFAHRGLKRFQAEMWSFEDWKQELDWMVKKRLNFFMLRIGMEDVWQRAFPDAVPYPDEYRNIEGTDAEGYNDRSDFWSLQYRGALREKVLQYARDLDLMFPTDCGTMTHWYSRTPQEFLEAYRPPFVTQEIAHYTASDTGKVFDFTQKDVMEYYMHLTDTMVKTYGESAALFHTIGLGERQIFKDPKKNFALKQIAYRRIAEHLRKHYPDSKLMLASWDFIGWWTPEEVQGLVASLDPERTLILDYTSEVDDPLDGFLHWGVVGKFPWVFGLFHAYESENEWRGPYERTDERLRVAAADPFCKGMILWPELSHSDPLVLEYLSRNAWTPLADSVEGIAERFCRQRYGQSGAWMNTCLQTLLPFIKLGDWSGYSRRKPDDPQYIEYYQNWYSHQDIWSKLSVFCGNDAVTSSALREKYAQKLAQAVPLLDNVIAALRELATHLNDTCDVFVVRDAVDLTRTVLGRMLNFAAMCALNVAGDAAAVSAWEVHYRALLDCMASLLGTVSDYSLYHTLEHLKQTAPINPQFETTFKRNVTNEYCAQCVYELATQIYPQECDAVFAWMKQANRLEKGRFAPVRKEIVDRFLEMPLSEMQPQAVVKPSTAVAKATEAVQRVTEEFKKIV